MCTQSREDITPLDPEIPGTGSRGTSGACTETSLKDSPAAKDGERHTRPDPDAGSGECAQGSGPLPKGDAGERLTT